MKKTHKTQIQKGRLISDDMYFIIKFIKIKIVCEKDILFINMYVTANEAIKYIKF